MNKTNLYREIKEIAKEELENVTLKNVEVCTDAFLKAVEKVLASGDSVSLINFGTFEVVKRPERIGRNPHTGEECVVPVCNGVKFRPSGKLKKAVNS